MHMALACTRCSHGPITGTNNHLIGHANRLCLHLPSTTSSPKGVERTQSEMAVAGVVAHAWNLYPGSSEAWPLTLCGTEDMSLGFSGGGGSRRALF